MSFDVEPDDPHYECGLEICNLKARVFELESVLEAVARRPHDLMSDFDDCVPWCLACRARKVLGAAKHCNPLDIADFVCIWPPDKRPAEQVVREVRDGVEHQTCDGGVVCDRSEPCLDAEPPWGKDAVPLMECLAVPLMKCSIETTHSSIHPRLAGCAAFPICVHVGFRDMTTWCKIHERSE